MRKPEKYFATTARVILCIVTGITGLNSGIALAQSSSNPVSLNDIIISAYDHHPQLKSLRAELMGTREILNEARASYRPQLALTGSASISERNAVLQDGTNFDQSTEPKALALRLNQTLYAGGRRKLLQQGAALTIKSSEARYETISISVAAEIIQDYMALLSAQAEYEILETSVENLIEVETAVTARKAVGDATRTDIAQAVSRLASARAQRISAQAALNLARDRLLSKTGFLVENPILPEQASLPFGEDYDDIIDMSQRRNPAIISSRLNEQSALVTVQSERRKYLPTISLSAAASTVRESSPTIARDDDLSVGINFTLPLYAGGSSGAQTRRALAAYNAARFTTDNVIRESDLRVKQLWSTLQSGKGVLEAQRANVAANVEALEGITRGEAVGLSTTTDILDAEENKLQAELALHRAQYQQYTALLLLRLYTGELDVYDFD